MICSPICLVYHKEILQVWVGVSSVTGISSGLPYTVQEEEKTNHGVLNSCTHFNRLMSEVKIVLKIHQWLFYRFTHCFVCSKMNDAFDVLIFLEDGKSVIKIAEINFIIFYFVRR